MACNPEFPDSQLYLQDALNALASAFGPGGGAATALNQVTGNLLLASIDGYTASLDGKLTNPLPVSGNVTVVNGAGAAAVNIQDGGNSITVDGTVSVSGSVAVTGPLTDAQLRATPVPVSGTVTATPATSATATTTTPTSASTTQVLKAANANRKGLIIYNKSDKILTICLSGTATTATGFPLAAEVALIGGYWECPFGYTGDVSGIWELLPIGTATVIELT